jgi:hypothetical protein
MEAKKYSVGDTLVLLFGPPTFDVNQGREKDFDACNKLYKNVQVHLIDPLNANSRLDLGIQLAITSCFTAHNFMSAFKETVSGLEFYLHDGWERKDKTSHVLNNGFSYDLEKIIPYVSNNIKDVHIYKFR